MACSLFIHTVLLGVTFSAWLCSPGRPFSLLHGSHAFQPPPCGSRAPSLLPGLFHCPDMAISPPISPRPPASATVIAKPGQPHHSPPSLQTSVLSADLLTSSLTYSLSTSQPRHCVPTSIVIVVCFGFPLRSESPTVFIRFLLLSRTTLQNQLRERRACFILQTQSVSTVKGSLGRNGSRTMEECCSLASSACCLIQSRITSPGAAMSTVG